MRTIEDLAAELRRVCERPRSGGKVVEIHLFGIRHAETLKAISLPALIERAGLDASYWTEIRKGMNLSPFVTVR